VPLQISGTLWNTGQSLVMRVEKDTKHHINITGGPLAYRYQFEEIYIHYGTENHQGSEHRVHGYAFPAEVGSHTLSLVLTCPNLHETGSSLM
jgi:Eukaryotic-type carbonic anhydrase